MDANLPAAAGQTALTTSPTEQQADTPAPAAQPTRQNVAVALLPLAIIGLLLISFVAAAWTFLAAISGT